MLLVGKADLLVKVNDFYSWVFLDVFLRFFDASFIEIIDKILLHLNFKNPGKMLPGKTDAAGDIL